MCNNACEQKETTFLVVIIIYGSTEINIVQRKMIIGSYINRTLPHKDNL